MDGQLPRISVFLLDGSLEQDASEGGAFTISDHPADNVAAINIDDRVEVVSRPGESHPRPLLERCGSLATHTAPIKQTLLSLRVASVRTDKAPSPRLSRGIWMPVSYVR